MCKLSFNWEITLLKRILFNFKVASPVLAFCGSGCGQVKVSLRNGPLSSRSDQVQKCPSGVNFINVLRTAFTCVEPKSVKKTVKLSVFFLLLGATGVKAIRKYVGEIEPRCQFYQH